MAVPSAKAIKSALRPLRLAWIHARDERFYRRPPVRDSDIDLAVATKGKDALIVVVAFNEPWLIDWQLQALQQHFCDSHFVIIGDNSTSPGASREIAELAARRGAGYVALPPMTKTDPSRSHGLALNWIHRNLLGRNLATYLVFLDHDIFPVRPVTYRDRIDGLGSFGRVRWSRERWFYWPGFAFYGRDFFRHGADFLPHRDFGDTGSSNWERYYSAETLVPEQSSSYEVVPVQRLFPHEKCPAEAGDREFQVIDHDWIHFNNGSNWLGEDAQSVLEHRQALAWVLGHYMTLDVDPRDLTRGWTAP